LKQKSFAEKKVQRAGPPGHGQAWSNSKFHGEEGEDGGQRPIRKGDRPVQGAPSFCKGKAKGGGGGGGEKKWGELLLEKGR